MSLASLGGGPPVGLRNAERSNSLTLLDVLRHLDTSVLGEMFKYSGMHSSDSLAGARASCKALRDIVDSNISASRLRVWPQLLTGWRSGQRPSPLARFARCTVLHLQLRSTSKHDYRPDEEAEELDEDTDPELMSWPPLLATMCLSGVGTDVGAGIHKLHLDADVWGLPSLASTAAVLSGRLTNVRELQFSCWRRAEQDVGSPRSVYAALAAAMPRLEKLTLPFNSWLPGCEALDGSCVTSITMDLSCGALYVEDARALTQIRQLTDLELNMDQWLLDQTGEPVRHLSNWADEENEDDNEEEEEDEEEGFPRDESDVQTVASLHPEHVEQLGALRWLLLHAPPALRSLRVKHLHGKLLLPPENNNDDDDDENSDASDKDSDSSRKQPAPDLMLDDVIISFDAGAVVGVEVGSALSDRGTPRQVAAGLNFLAAALLPRLEATGQRQLPLLKLGCLEVLSSNLLKYLVQQPRSPLVRLLERCERKELGTLRLVDLYAITAGPSAADNDVARALQAVARLIGVPDYLQSHVRCELGFRVRLGPGSKNASVVAAPGAGAGSGCNVNSEAATGSSASGGTSAVGGAAMLALPVVTADWVLTRAAQLLWGAVAGEGDTDASAAACELARRSTDGEDKLLRIYDVQDHFVVLRGQLIRQLLLSGDGPKLLHAWLTGVLRNKTVVGGAAPSSLEGAASDRGQAGAEPADAAGAAAVGEQLNCGVMSLWPPAATAVVGCWTRKEAERLACAAAAAGALAIGSLEVRAMSLARKTMYMMPHQSPWSCLINMVLQEVWNARSPNGLLPGGGTAAEVVELRAEGAAGGGSAGAAGGAGGGGGGVADVSGASPGTAAGPSTLPGAAVAGVSGAASLDVDALRRLVALAVEAHDKLVEQRPARRCFMCS